MKTIRLPLATVLLCPLLAGLVACGSSAGGPQVARLPSHAITSPSPSKNEGSPVGAKSGDTSSDPDSGRPVLRLDDTPQRTAALANAYNKCLIENGASPASGTDIVAGPGDGKGGPGILVHQPVPARAKAACLHLLPLQPPALDASTNPKFHAQSLAYVNCLKQHGEWVQLLNNHDLSWTYVEGHPVPENNGQIENTCLLQAFGDK